VRRYLPLVYHAASRQLGGDVHAAEDVAQKVFTLLAGKAAGLAGHVSLAGWLHTTTRLIARETLRAERRRRAREEEAHLMQELSHQDAAEPDWRQVRPIIDEAVTELSARDRDAVLLRFFAGLPLAQVGARINLSENAARMRVERALEKLRVSLARRGVASTAGALSLLLETQAAAALPVGFAGVVTNQALTGAAATGAVGGFSKILGFMSIPQLNGTVITACVLVVTLGTATHEILACRDERQALTRAVREHAAVRASVEETLRRAAMVAQENATLKQRIEAARVASAEAATRLAAGTRAAKVAVPADPVAAGNAFMANHPEVKSAVNDYAKARVLFQYGELLRALNLTAGQIDLFVATQRFGMAASDADGKSLSLVSDDSLGGNDAGAKLTAALGEEGIPKYMEFARVAQARDLAVKMAGALYFTDTPLTPPQADRLGQIIADKRNAARGWQPQLYDWDAITAEAAGILSPPQLQILAGLRAKDRFQQALNGPIPKSTVSTK
jgi:RNA polymerase sigma factor (sigma-70 family)